MLQSRIRFRRRLAHQVGNMCRIVAVIRPIIARHLVMDGLPLIEEITLERHLMAVASFDLVVTIK